MAKFKDRVARPPRRRHVSVVDQTENNPSMSDGHDEDPETMAVASNSAEFGDQNPLDPALDVMKEQRAPVQDRHPMAEIQQCFGRDSMEADALTGKQGVPCVRCLKQVYHDVLAGVDVSPCCTKAKAVHIRCIRCAKIVHLCTWVSASVT
nr:hypothetical protein CFP56_68790 [Quercus suber]